MIEVKTAASEAGEKYAIKAREFQRLATKIAEEAGSKSGEKTGEQEGGEAGEEAGEIAGEKAGRLAGQKAGEKICGEDGGKVGARAGKKFGFKVGREAGVKAGMEVGRLEGKKAGGAAGAAEALKHFKIGISKDRVLALKKFFAEIGAAAGVSASKEFARISGAKRGEEEGSKFGLEHGRKAGAAAARKLKDAEAKILKEEGALVGEQAGGEAGEKAGIEEGEKAGGEEAERLGAEEGAKLGREIGAEAARLAGAKFGKKIGKTAGAKAGRDAGKKAGIEHAALCAVEISKEKVTSMRKLFAEISTGAGTKAGLAAARAEVMKAVREVAIRASAKATREALLAMASRGKVKLSADWKPTSLIAVINARSDLSDMEKIKLAAKAKMEGNLSDLLPQRFKADGNLRNRDDPLSGKLKFTASTSSEAKENVDTDKKWKTVVFTDLPEDPQKADTDMSKEKVSSLKKRFETKNMKDNEAYVIM